MFMNYFLLLELFTVLQFYVSFVCSMVPCSFTPVPINVVVEIEV